MRRIERAALPVLLLGVLAVLTAQQTLFPVLPPLARAVGLTEVWLGFVMTTSAIVFAVASLLWGRLVDRWGTRSVLVAGLVLALVGLVGFAAASQVALAGGFPPPVTLALMLLTRSALFGAGIGAVPVAALAYVARSTSGESERTRGVGRLGAVQGVAMALGPGLGGVLGFAGLLGPIWLAPALVASALLAVLVLLPPATGGPAVDDRLPARPSLRPWDPRFWPFLMVGFLLFLSLGVTVIVLGFLFQDRLGLAASDTVQLAGASAFATGLVLVGVQGLVVPKLAWPAVRLLRTGTPIAAVGLIALAFAPNFPTMLLSHMTFGLGLAVSIPGYTSAPTLRVEGHEQGAVAGLISANNGVTFVIGPLAGTALYQLDPTLPMLAGSGCCLLALLFIVLHPGVRSGAAGSVTPGSVPAGQP